MSFGLNSVSISGTLTRDPEVRGLPSGGAVCSMRIAHNSSRKDASGQWVDVPNFLNVTVFSGQGEWLGKNLVKGDEVAVQGELRWREYQDRDGNKREAIEIVARNVFPRQRDRSRSGGGRQRQGGGQQGGGWGGGTQQRQTPGGQYPVDQGDFAGQGAPAGGDWGGGWGSQGQQGQQGQPAPQPQGGSQPAWSDDAWNQPGGGPPPATGGQGQPPADDDIPF